VNTTLRGRLPLALILTFILAGCVKNNPTPTPAPIQMADSVNALAQTVDAATTGLISARDAGKLSQEDLAIAFRVIGAISITGKQINAELRSIDTWELQKAKILQIIVDSGLAELSKELSPNARAIMLACLTLYNSISTGFGGPTL
jgi:cell division FtsZ-interacting protein ZapD